MFAADDADGRKGAQIQVISSHPLVAQNLVKILSANPCLQPFLAKSPIFDFDSPPSGARRLFILDALFLPLELAKLVRILRVRHPPSQFLALIPPEGWADEEILRLLYLGVEAIVRISDNLEEELAAAIEAVLAGGVWAPRHMLAEYVRQTNWLRSEQFLSRFSLTSREVQILQLVMRRFSNKEISSALRISERTVKFHVSNIFGKVGVNNRQGLLTAITVPPPEPLKS
jgi:DNA-binding NarL/FixJ family response regulator